MLVHIGLVIYNQNSPQKTIIFYYCTLRETRRDNSFKAHPSLTRHIVPLKTVCQEESCDERLVSQLVNARSRRDARAWRPGASGKVSAG